MSVKVLAKFVGTTTYLDSNRTTPAYINGEYYVLIIGKDNDNNVEKQDGTGKIQYGSIKRFCENWNYINQVKE